MSGRVGAKRWSQAEDDVLRENWTICTHVGMAQMLMNRNMRSVRNRCWRLGLVQKTEWDDADLLVLREWYAAKNGQPLDLDSLAQKLGRTRWAVCIKARKIGLTDQKRTAGGKKDRRKFKGDHAAAMAAVGEATKQRIAKNGHPRGMLGKKKTKESAARTGAGVKAWRSLQSKETLDEITNRGMATKLEKYGTYAPRGFMDGSSNPYSRAKRGRREDLDNRFFRSRWEANYARFLNMLKKTGDIAGWEYEPDTFWFEKIKRGVRSYTPDFKITERSGSTYYIEVKGWMDDKSKTKLDRMKRYHPTVDVRVFGPKAYHELERKLGVAIPGWESSR